MDANLIQHMQSNNHYTSHNQNRGKIHVGHLNTHRKKGLMQFNKLTIVKMRSQQKCPSTAWLPNARVRYVHTVVLFNYIKESVAFARGWMNLSTLLKMYQAKEAHLLHVRTHVWALTDSSQGHR